MILGWGHQARIEYRVLDVSMAQPVFYPGEIVADMKQVRRDRVRVLLQREACGVLPPME